MLAQDHALIITENIKAPRRSGGALWWRGVCRGAARERTTSEHFCWRKNPPRGPGRPACPTLKALEGEVTVSVGVCAHDPASEAQTSELIGAADKALYVAKASGRNMSVIAN